MAAGHRVRTSYTLHLALTVPPPVPWGQPCAMWGELLFHRVEGAWERFAKPFDGKAQNSRPGVTVPSMYWEIRLLQVSLGARSKPHLKFARE